MEQPAAKRSKFFELFRQTLTQVITLRFNSVRGGFDDAPLREGAGCWRWKKSSCLPCRETLR